MKDLCQQNLVSNSRSVRYELGNVTTSAPCAVHIRLEELKCNCKILLLEIRREAMRRTTCRSCTRKLNAERRNGNVLNCEHHSPQILQVPRSYTVVTNGGIVLWLVSNMQASMPLSIYSSISKQKY